jgi:hypothetical protein
MRFTIPLVAFALGVAALPAADIAFIGAANILAEIQTPYDHPPQVDGGEPTWIAASDKRSVAVGATLDTLAKRATLNVDIWADQNRGGRHEALFTESMYIQHNSSCT